MSTENEENPPIPSWLQKLEEQRERRIKGRLGHEAGAGAKCQKCEDKCPGLDLHFWRKICKICKCGKEDHDVNDEDIYGFVQFQLLGSRPVKSKGAFLKDRKDEVILEWTPKGATNDVKKYLDELPVDMLPIKGTEGAKIRKQRLQKQMPAHDIDASLCHQLTEGEIKKMEEYVSHIRKNCVGQGKIVRLSLFKGSRHQIPPSNQQILSQIVPNQIASSQNVLLHSSDLANNLHNLNIRDKNKQPENALKKPVVPNLSPQNVPLISDHQNPANIGKITDLNYLPSAGKNVQNVIHPLTTSNVERHQEQFEIQNANFDYSNYAPNFVNPIEHCQIPTQVGQPKDIKYPVGNRNFDENQFGQLKDVNYPNFINPVNQEQVPTEIGQPKNIKYPSDNLPPINNATHPLMQSGGPQNLDNINYSTINNKKMPLQQYGPNFVNPTENIVLPTQIGGPRDLKYPNEPQNLNPQFENYPNYGLGPQMENIVYPTEKGPHKDVNYSGGPLNNPTENIVLPTQTGGPRDLKYPNYGVGPQFENMAYLNEAGPHKGGPLNNPINANPTENIVLPTQIGGPRDLKYPNYGLGPQFENMTYPTESGAHNDSGGPQNNPINSNKNLGPSGIQKRGPEQYQNLGPNANQFENSMGPPKDINYTSGTQNNPINANQYLGQSTGTQKKAPEPNYQNLYPTNVGPPKDINYTSGTQNLDPINANTYLNQSGPQIPILEAQNLINPLEALQNFQSVGYLHDINYSTSNIPNSTQDPKTVFPGDHNSNQSAPKCHGCGDNFEDGAVAVSVERIEDKWHPKCFICKTCKQPLVDLVYLYHKETNDIYCERDYAVLKGIPRCQACDELIFVREYCLAEENTYHVKHFCCFECDGPLAGKQYVLENNQTVCFDCYENLKSELCQTCQNKIKPDEQGVSLQNLHWHANDDCFVCKKCEKSLLGGKLLLKNQQLFCSDICFKSYQV